MPKVGLCDAVIWGKDVKNMTCLQVLSLAADIYLYCGGRRVQVISSNKKTLNVTFREPVKDTPLWFTIGKVITYFTVILPLIAFAIKAIVRCIYTFKVVDEKAKLQEEEFATHESTQAHMQGPYEGEPTSRFRLPLNSGGNS